jgi:hypothetical protein
MIFAAPGSNSNTHFRVFAWPDCMAVFAGR